METVEFVANGVPHRLEVDPAMPLALVLRDRLRLQGTKVSCGVGVCGACTVHVDGEPMRACSTPIGAVRGRQVLTIEGLSATGDHPLQRAWRAEQVPQCGYCQSGQIMQAAALLARPGTPDRATIVEHMADNLCRCGTYGRIVRAIERAVAEAKG
jgi:isoquinoline 1-oxidoreductase alpha subunit